MTVITSGRRCNPFSLPAISLAIVLVFGLYAWSVQLENRLTDLSSLLGPDDGLQATDEDLKFEWALAETGSGGVAVQAEAPHDFPAPGQDAPELPAGLDADVPLPNDGSRMMAVENPFANPHPSEDSTNDPDIADSWKSQDTQPPGGRVTNCRGLPGAENVLIVMKTGATEILRRLPVHLLTTFTCVSDYLIFSSMSQTVGHVQIHDALANISDAAKAADPTLSTLYPRLKEYHHKGWDVSYLAPEGAWDLDKWKNVPMATEAYRLYPDKKWFVFMDADSGIMWSNLLHLLSRLNPSEPQYLGSPVFIENTEFAHGGSGYIVSGAAMRKLSLIEAEKKALWEQRTAQVCCGDMMFAEALRDAGVTLTSLVPAAYGGTPRTVEWTSDTWCRAPVFFHHMGLEENEELWTWEQGWLRDNGRSQPILFGDMFYHFVGQYLLNVPDETGETPFPPDDMRTNWSNMASGAVFTPPVATSPEAVAATPESTEPYSSAEACLTRCQAEEWCVQWLWAPQQCVLGEVPVLGRTPRTNWDQGGGEQMDNMVSGWFKERIAYYVGKFGQCSKGSDFPVKPL